VRGWFRRHALGLTVVVLMFLFGFVVFWPRIVITIRPARPA